jgi:hypothetical protein
MLHAGQKIILIFYIFVRVFFLFSWHDSYILLQHVTIFLFVKLFLCWVACLLEMAGSPALGNKFTPDEVSARADSGAGIKPGPI